MRISVLSALGASVLVSACAREQQKPVATPAPVITIHAKDYAYMAPDTVPAGMVTMHLINDGPALHHAAIVRLDSGKTSADLDEALKHPDKWPAWAQQIGGPNAPAPGDTASAILDLAPGNYDIVCFVDLPGGVPHFMRGMTHPFVVAASNASNVAPTADVALNLVDYGFTFSKPLTSGHHVIAVTNSATQPHEIEIVKMAPGKTEKDFMSWIVKPQGPPPGMPLGGVAGMDPGDTVYLPVDLAPGTYLYLCLLPDVHDGKPHFMHGMMHMETIE